LTLAAAPVILPFFISILMHTAVFLLAERDITNDIKTGLGVLKQQAEQ
jgi:hypothetical protein